MRRPLDYAFDASGRLSGSLARRPLLDPASEEVDLILRPGSVARHRAVLELGEDPGGGVPDVVMRPEVEVRLNRLAVLLPEQRPNVGRETDYLPSLVIDTVDLPFRGFLEERVSHP